MRGTHRGQGPVGPDVQVTVEQSGGRVGRAERPQVHCEEEVQEDTVEGGGGVLRGRREGREGAGGRPGEGGHKLALAMRVFLANICRYQGNL